MTTVNFIRPDVQLLAGVDEVGRGPLIGAVVTAAVILDPNRPILGLTDSKKLSEKRRVQLAAEIKEKALCWSLGRAEVAEIDALNILQATMLAMTRAVAGLRITPEWTLIDGNRVPAPLVGMASAVVKGDALVPEISAASIIAKVARDDEMQALHAQYPQYNFAAHKGYPTAEHLAAIAKYGILSEHRRSFKPIRDLL